MLAPSFLHMHHHEADDVQCPEHELKDQTLNELFIGFTIHGHAQHSTDGKTDEDQGCDHMSSEGEESA